MHLRPRLPPLLVKSFRLGLPVPLPRPASPPRRRPDAAWVAGAASSASLSGASSPSRASSKVPQQLPRILRQLLLRRHPCHLRRSPIPLPRPGRRARPAAAAWGLPRGGPLPPPLPPVRSGFLPERLHLYNFNFKHNQADVHQLVVKVSGRHRHATSAGGVVLAFPAAWVRVVAVGGCALRLRCRPCWGGCGSTCGFPTSLVSAGRPGHRLRHLRHRRRPPPGGPTPLQGPLLPLHLRPRLPPLRVKSFRLRLPGPLPRPASPPRRSRLARCGPSPSSFAPPDPPPRDLRVLLPCDYKARGVRLRCRSRGRRPVHFQFQAQPGRGWSCLSGGGGPCPCGPGGCSSPWSRPCRGPWWRCHGRRGGGDGDLSRKRRCGLCRRWTWRRSLWGDLCCWRCRRVLAGCGRGLRA